MTVCFDDRVDSSFDLIQNGFFDTLRVQGNAVEVFRPQIIHLLEEEVLHPRKLRDTPDHDVDDVAEEVTHLLE